MVKKVRPFRHPCPTESELKSIAERPLLEKCEVISLIQGFLPDRGKSDISYSYLDEYAPQVMKINNAETLGHIRFPIRIKDFIFWCAENKVPLPEIFWDAASRKFSRIENWKIRSKLFTDEFTRPQIKRHSANTSVTVRGYNPRVAKVAREIFMTHILNNGHTPRKQELSDKVSKKTGLPNYLVDRAYALRTLCTQSEIERLRKKYRREKPKK